MAESLADRMRGLLASDVYTEKGRLRADDLLVRERVGSGLSAAAARVRDLISAWRTDRVPAVDQGAAVPARRGDGADPPGRAPVRAIDETAGRVRGLPLLNADRVWDRVRRVGLDELMQFDWTLVGEADALVTDLADVFGLDEIDAAAVEARLRKIREVVSDRQKYIEISLSPLSDAGRRARLAGGPLGWRLSSPGGRWPRPGAAAPGGR